jgi:hypothetical protein
MARLLMAFAGPTSVVQAAEAPPPGPTKNDAATVEKEAETESALMRPQPLSLYGFTDFGFNKFYTSDKSQLNLLFPSKAGTFVLGNVNLFLDAEPYDDWRSLVEIRFTNLPDGYERTLGSPAGPYQRDNTTIQDYTSPSIRGSVTLGSIVIERAQTEYAFSDAFKVMAGYFFTPWGIWNVDHGTPTLISLLLPSFMADDYLPLRQLGVQAYGSFYTPHWEFGYHAYLGNNRTPSQVDFNDNKSFGARVFASSTGSAVKAKFGLSGYYGHGYDISKDIVAVDPYQVQTTTTVAYREWMAGADASIDAGALRLRLEGLVRRVDYEPGKNPSNDGADGTYYGDGYVLLAYALPFWGFEPYFYGEAIHWKSNLGDTALIPSVGLNVHVNPAVQLKMQYGHAMFMNVGSHDVKTPSDNNVDNLAARLVVSF